MNVAQIKENVTIPDYLRSFGIEAAKVSPRGMMYRCPWRDDRHPSLSVTADGRAWYDHSTGESGSIIDLAMKMMNTTDLAEICAEMASFSLHKSKTIDQRKEKESFPGVDAFKSFNVVPLHSKKLLSYLSGRGIQEEVAKGYCEEAHYSFTDDESFLYAVAFKNEKGGYELRNDHFKGCRSPKGITLHTEQFGVPMVVFEGFIDMLSFATMEGRNGRKHNYCVLNSVTNAETAIERLSGMGGKIYLCLDNDQAGRETTAKMLKQLPQAMDISSRFAPFKDLNDYLISTQKH